MARAKKVHVEPRGDGWAVRGEGQRKLTSVHQTQAEAIDHARQLATKQGAAILIHAAGGRVVDRPAEPAAANVDESSRPERYRRASAMIRHWLAEGSDEDDQRVVAALEASLQQGVAIGRPDEG